MIDANGNRAKFEYDGFDRPVKWVFPSAVKPSAYSPSSPASALATAGSVNNADYEEYGYDANGNRISFRKRDGSTLTYTFDALNRMTIKTVPERSGLNTTHTRDVFFGYDLLGRQTYAHFDSTSGNGLNNVWDGLGRLTSVTQAMDGWSRKLSYMYDNNGNRTRVTFPDFYYVTYSYDGQDRPLMIQRGGTATLASYSYDAAGRRSAFNTGSAITTGYGYDGIGRLTSLSNSPTVASYANQYVFSYNPVNQITSLTRSNDAFAFSGAYNVSRNYSTNGLNQYTTAGSAVFTYDANGNLTSDGVNTYTYDIENRLVEVSGGTAATLRYDPLGRLYEVVGAQGTTRFLNDGDALAAEFNASGGLLRRYVHGADIASDDPIAWYEGASFAASAERLLRPDWQGSIVLVTSSIGSTVIAANTYDEYGIPGVNNKGRFQFTGQAYIAEIGMYYYKARIYSPTLGRFLQTDPVGYKDQINLYAYVGNDPVNHGDPTGTECVNSSNGTTHCVYAGRYDVTFKTPAGFQNTNPNASDGHQYSKPNVSPLNAAQTREWVKNNPTPGSPSPATPQGTANNASPTGTAWIKSSPVTSYTTVNQTTGNSVVVNVTMPGHPLGNGIVVRDVTPNANGTSTIQNYGEGNGTLQSRGSPVSGLINGVWQSPSMRPPSPEPAPKWDRCVSHPGSC